MNLITPFLSRPSEDVPWSREATSTVDQEVKEEVKEKNQVLNKSM